MVVELWSPWRNVGARRGASPETAVALSAIARPITRSRRRIRLGRKNAAADSAPRRLRSARSAGSPAPVIEQHVAAGVRDQPLQREDQDEQIVDLAEERNEVRNEVDRHDDVRDRAGDEQLVDHRHAPVAQQPAEQPQVLRQAA